MQQFTYMITDPAGLHARPAGAFVKKVKELGCTVTVQKGDKTAPADKLFALMAMGIKVGDTITVTIDGEQAEASASALQTLLTEIA